MGRIGRVASAEKRRCLVYFGVCGHPEMELILETSFPAFYGSYRSLAISWYRVPATEN